jgi:hypothetical protein
MAELTKQALQVENNTQFPNNNAGVITPTRLRGFNSDMIDSLVDEIGYNADSASWNNDINELQNFSSSLDNNFASQTEFETYTASQDSKNATLASYTGSNDTKWNTLGGQTGSYVTSAITGSSLVTASFDNGTRNLTFTKGDATTFNVNIPDVSGSAGDFVTTSSFNSYTQSNDERVSSLEAATASYVTSAITASSLVTASVSGTTMTFTKGDASTLDVTLPTGSGGGGTIDTGSFATTGSNTFRGDQTISNSGNNNLYISTSTSGQSNIYLQSPGLNNL